MFQILDRPLPAKILGTPEPLTAEWLVIHSTANTGATDEGHYKWLAETDRDGWAHYYLDWGSISRFVPEGFVAPAQGWTGNRKAISIEICEGATETQFVAAWQRAAWLAADILWRYGWGVDRLKPHAEISKLYPGETNHTDPIGFFAKWGRTWTNFLAAVQLNLNQFGDPLPVAAPWQTDAVTRLMQTKLPDGTPMLNDRRHPLEEVKWFELALMLERNRLIDK